MRDDNALVPQESPSQSVEWHKAPIEEVRDLVFADLKAELASWFEATPEPQNEIPRTKAIAQMLGRLSKAAELRASGDLVPPEFDPSSGHWELVRPDGTRQQIDFSDKELTWDVNTLFIVLDLAFSNGLLAEWRIDCLEGPFVNDPEAAIASIEQCGLKPTTLKWLCSALRNQQDTEAWGVLADCLREEADEVAKFHYTWERRYQPTRVKRAIIEVIERLWTTGCEWPTCPQIVDSLVSDLKKTYTEKQIYDHLDELRAKGVVESKPAGHGYRLVP